MPEIPAADADVEADYVADGWWGTESLSQVVARHAVAMPDSTALVDEHGDRMSWSTYDADADLIARSLVGTGLERGARVAVFLPDGPLLHAAFVGAERAGLVVVGIGHRAGEAEVRYLIEKTGARAIITGDPRPDVPDLAHHLVLRGTSTSLSVDGSEAATDLSGREPVGPSELFLLNSTSGTTGLPKCV